MMVKLYSHTIQRWFTDFVDALQETHADKVVQEPLVPEPSPAWPLQSVGARYH
jgi:trehalose 6-phosphate synthase